MKGKKTKLLTSPCIHACLLTPTASYITIRMHPSHTGSSESLTPWQNATDVVNAVHNTECDDGIPSEFTSIARSHLFSTKKFKYTFMN